MPEPLDLDGDVVDLLRALIDLESVSGDEARSPTRSRGRCGRTGISR